MCVCVCVCVCRLHTVRNWEIVSTPFLSPPTHFPPSVGFFFTALVFRFSWFACLVFFFATAAMAPTGRKDRHS